MIGRTCKRSNALSEAGTNGRGLDLVHATSTLLDRVRKGGVAARIHDDRCFHLRRAPDGARSTIEDYPGDASGEDPPVPIPNTEVKLSSAEDTRGATPWENRSSPGYSYANPVGFTGGAVGILRDVDRICPLLGLQGEGRTAIDGVDSGHRCHAEQPPTALDRQQQARVCLTADHERCERYLAHATRNGGLRPARSGILDGLVSTRMILAPDPAWRGIAGRARRAPTVPLLAIGAAGLALGIGGVAVASGMVADGLGQLGALASSPASPSPTPSPSATPRPSRTPTPTASPTPSPTPSPTTAPTTAPTVAPTAPPPPPAQQTYLVQEGDTLAAIAQRFGTTVSALQEANGIEDPDEIVIGQRLVIP